MVLHAVVNDHDARLEALRTSPWSQHMILKVKKGDALDFAQRILFLLCCYRLL